jgi:hypothetical protein
MGVAVAVVSTIPCGRFNNTLPLVLRWPNHNDTRDGALAAD